MEQAVSTLKIVSPMSGMIGCWSVCNRGSMWTCRAVTFPLTSLFFKVSCVFGRATINCRTASFNTRLTIQLTWCGNEQLNSSPQRLDWADFSCFCHNFLTFKILIVDHCCESTLNETDRAHPFLPLCDILVLKAKTRYWEMYIISYWSNNSEIVADK